MAFVSNRDKIVGKRVVLTRDVEVVHGTFERGTEMTVTEDGPRGLDMVDDQGNYLRETGLMGDSFYRKL